MILCLQNSTRAGFVAILIAASASRTFGGIPECAQAFVPGRVGSALDVRLNFAGVGLGLLVVILHRRAARASAVSTEINTISSTGKEA